MSRIVSRYSTLANIKRDIRYVNRQSVQWFPGHMNKGMKDIHKSMPNVDVMIEIHDARIPFSGRPEFFQKFGLIRPTILLMNKMDLAEPVGNLSTHEAKLNEYYNNYGNPAALYFTQLNSPEKQKRLLKKLIISLPNFAQFVGHQMRIGEEFNVMTNSNTSKFSVPSTITGMVVGIPNSGKSTLINALRNIGQGGGGGAAKVGRLAGHTRVVGQPIIISRGSKRKLDIGDMVDDFGVLDSQILTDYRIQMLDTPGILEPRAKTLCEQLSLCVCGAIKLESLDQEILVDYLLFWWNHRKRYEYVSVLNLTEPTHSVLDLLTHVCVQQNFYYSTSNYNRFKWEPWELESSSGLNLANTLNFNQATSYILRLFNKGRFGRTTFLPEDEKKASEYFILATRN